MTDDLLDEATRLADYLDVHPELTVDDADRRIVRALVERVREAEAARDDWKTRWRGAVENAQALGHDRFELLVKLEDVREAAAGYLNECDQSERLARRIVEIIGEDE